MVLAIMANTSMTDSVFGELFAIRERVARAFIAIPEGAGPGR